MVYELISIYENCSALVQLFRSSATYAELNKKKS